MTNGESRICYASKCDWMKTENSKTIQNYAPTFALTFRMIFGFSLFIELAWLHNFSRTPIRLGSAFFFLFRKTETTKSKRNNNKKDWNNSALTSNSKPIRTPNVLKPKVKFCSSENIVYSIAIKTQHQNKRSLCVYVFSSTQLVFFSLSFWLSLLLLPSTRIRLFTFSLR